MKHSFSLKCRQGSFARDRLIYMMDCPFLVNKKVTMHRDRSLIPDKFSYLIDKGLHEDL